MISRNKGRIFPIDNSKAFQQMFIGDIQSSDEQMVLRGDLVVDMPMPQSVLTHVYQAMRDSGRIAGLGHNQSNYHYMLSELVGIDAAFELTNELSDMVVTRRRSRSK